MMSVAPAGRMWCVHELLEVDAQRSLYCAGARPLRRDEALMWWPTRNSISQENLFQTNCCMLADSLCAVPTFCYWHKSLWEKKQTKTTTPQIHLWKNKTKYMQTMWLLYIERWKHIFIMCSIVWLLFFDFHLCALKTWLLGNCIYN